MVHTEVWKAYGDLTDEICCGYNPELIVAHTIFPNPIPKNLDKGLQVKLR